MVQREIYPQSYQEKNTVGDRNYNNSRMNAANVQKRRMWKGHTLAKSFASPPPELMVIYFIIDAV